MEEILARMRSRNSLCNDLIDLTHTHAAPLHYFFLPVFLLVSTHLWQMICHAGWIYSHSMCQVIGSGQSDNWVLSTFGRKKTPVSSLHTCPLIVYESVSDDAYPFSDSDPHVPVTCISTGDSCLSIITRIMAGITASHAITTDIRVTIKLLLPLLPLHLSYSLSPSTHTLWQQ